MGPFASVPTSPDVNFILSVAFYWFLPGDALQPRGHVARGNGWFPPFALQIVRSVPRLTASTKAGGRSGQGDRVKKLPCDQLCEEVVISSGGLALEPQ